MITENISFDHVIVDWHKHVVATTGSHNMAILDIDGDGLLDIIGSNWNNNSPTRGTIEVWLNRCG